MSEPTTAQGSARAAEERAKKQQRQVIRDVIRADAELRAAIIGDLREELREVVREEQTGQLNDILRQAREQRMAEHVERQAEARARAPRQVSLDSGLNLTTQGNGGSRVISRGYDLEHSPEFMHAIQKGKSRDQALELARQAHPDAGPRRWQPRSGGDASAYAYQTESPDVLWETRNGPLRAARSAHQAPHEVDESWRYAPGPPADTAASVLPGERNSPLNRGI